MKWANIKQNNFNIYNASFKKNNNNKEKKSWCHYQNLHDIIYSSWDIKQNILKLEILDHFLPFYPPPLPPQKKPCKNQNFQKWKNLLELSSFYTCALEITIIWCMVPEMWSETPRIFCHFGSFFTLSTPSLFFFEKIKKHMDILSFYTSIP